MYSAFFKKDFAKPLARRGCSAYASESDSILRHSIFVIRNSIRRSSSQAAVRFSARPPAVKATRLIIKKPHHFGVVSHELLSATKTTKSHESKDPGPEGPALT